MEISRNVVIYLVMILFRKHVLLTPSFHPLADITPTPRSQLSHRERVTCRDRNGNISDVLAVLSPIGELDSFYSSDSPVSQLPKRPNRRELEPLHYLFLPKSQQTRDFKPQTSPYPISEGSSIESLNPNGPSTQVFEDQIENSEFQFGLSLLRANILVLCIKSGIDPQKLYPPEALLLNLDLLQQETIKYVSLHDSISTKMENHQYTYASLPPSLERLVDPYPSLNPEQDLLHDDGEYVFSEPEVDIEQLGSLSPILDDSLPSHRFQDHLIASPMRKFEEDMVDGQEWALIEEPEEIENYYH